MSHRFREKHRCLFGKLLRDKYVVKRDDCLVGCRQ